MNKPPSADSQLQSSGKRESVARATGVVSLMTLLSRVLGLVRDMAIANYFGAGKATDAFFVAFKVPNLLRRLVAEGSLSTAFVPIFVEERERSEDQSHRAVGAVTSFTMLLTGTLTVLGIVYASEITLLFAPGFATDPSQVKLSADLLALMFPYVILVSALALASSILNALGKFAMPALAPALLNVAMIAAVLLVSPQLEDPVFALAWSVLVGGVLALLPQLALLRRLGLGLHFRNPLKSPAVARLLRLMLPSILSSSFYQFMVFINTLLASMLAAKSVSWLFYADRLFQFPLGVFSMAVATAVLPSFSRHAARKDYTALNRQLTAALRWMTVITVPATVGLIVLSEPIISAIFEHGRFGAEDRIETAASLCAFAIGLWSVSCQSLIVRGFLAQKNSLIPSLVACASILLNIVIAFMLMGPAARVPEEGLGRAIAALQEAVYVFALGHVGLALAGSLSSMISVVALMALLPRVQIHVNLASLGLALAKTLTASAAMGLVLWAALDLIPGNALATVLTAVPAGLLVFILASTALGLSEARTLWALLAELYRGDKGSSPDGEPADDRGSRS